MTYSACASEFYKRPCDFWDFSKSLILVEMLQWVPLRTDAFPSKRLPFDWVIYGFSYLSYGFWAECKRLSIVFWNLLSRAKPSLAGAMDNDTPSKFNELL